MYRHGRQVDVIHQFVVELYGVASREEHHDLFVQVSLQESEQQQETAGGRANHVALCQPFHGSDVVDRLCLNKDWFLQRKPRKISHLSRLGCRKQRSLPLLRQHLDDQVEFLLEPNLEDPIRLIDSQVHQVVKYEPLRVLHVIQKTPWGCHENVDALGQLLRLRSTVHSTNHDAMCLGHILPKIAEYIVNLHCQFSSRRYHQSSNTVPRQELCVVEQIHCWNEEGQSLSRTCLGSGQHILAIEQVWNRLGLDLGHCLKFALLESPLHRVTDWQLLKTLRTEETWSMYGLLCNCKSSIYTRLCGRDICGRVRLCGSAIRLLHFFFSSRFYGGSFVVRLLLSLFLRRLFSLRSFAVCRKHLFGLYLVLGSILSIFFMGGVLARLLFFTFLGFGVTALFSQFPSRFPLVPRPTVINKIQRRLCGVA
mmetsp:Transcript_2584/g.7712  ORF Transcript_2584/g.7712 Transcript_2584/m.7712 type:complete len:423 (+) Transcript_2584:931-2199(+)